MEQMSQTPQQLGLLERIMNWMNTGQGMSQVANTGVATGVAADATGSGPATGGVAPQLTGWQKVGSVADLIGSVGSLWGSIQQNKIAKQQLALSREAYNTNMNNTIKSYNTTLEDRIRARYTMEGRDSTAADSYIEKNRMTR